MTGNYFNIDFELTSLFVMLAGAVYVFTKYSDTTASNREFKRLVISNAAFSAASVFASLSIYEKAGVVPEVVANSFYYLFCVGTNFNFMMYVRSYVFKERRASVPKKIISALFPLLMLVVFFANYRAGFLFFIDDDFSFSYGKFFFLMPAFNAFFSLLSLKTIFTMRRKYTGRQIAILSAASLLTAAIPFLQSRALFGFEASAFIYSVLITFALFTIETPDDQLLLTTINELELLEKRLRKTVDEKTQSVQEQGKKLERLTQEMMYALAEMIDAKDRYTSGHSARVARYSKMLAQKKGMSESECRKIFMMGILHDIGKVGIPNSIINKPDKLTDNEFSIIKRHPAIGSDILDKVTMFPELRTGARWHHERVDGRGYPDGLTGDKIPLEAKIIAVADAYDAMTSNRSYRPLMEQAKVREQIVSGISRQFDNEIAALMVSIIDEDTEYRLHEYSGGENDY